MPDKRFTRILMATCFSRWHFDSIVTTIRKNYIIAGVASILDSERSDECIYFIMVWDFLFYFNYFFVSDFSVWGINTASIFFNSILFDGKVNLVSVFGRSTFKTVFKSAGKNKFKKNGIFYAKSVFHKIGVTLKQIHR